MKCEHPNCNKDEDVLFYCKYCKKSLCEEHRDPQNHNCTVGTPGGTSQQTQTGATPADFMKAFAEQVQKNAQRAQQQAQEAYYRRFSDASEEQKKKFLEERLTASPGIISFGNEIIDLIVGFGLIILAFGFTRLVFSEDWWGFLVSAVLIGTAFLPHELAHKYVAIKKGQFARYVLWLRGILLTFFTLIIGIGLVVPGFVAILPMDPRKKMSEEDNGIVSFAGPFTNAIIGTVSLMIGLLFYYSIIPVVLPQVIKNIFFQITLFNGLIALFNCIPLWQLDGRKILKWNKLAYFSLIAVNVALVVPPFLLGITLI